MQTPGKRVAEHLYLHVSALHTLDPSHRERVEAAAALEGLQPEADFNVIKLSGETRRLSLLDYPGFFDEAFPVLRRYWTVDAEAGTGPGVADGLAPLGAEALAARLLAPPAARQRREAA